GSRFDQLRGSARVRAFLTGAGPAAIGAIAGATIPLGLALAHLWQLALLALAAAWLLGLRRGVVAAVVGAGALGVIAALAGAPVTCPPAGPRARDGGRSPHGHFPPASQQARLTCTPLASFCIPNATPPRRWTPSSAGRRTDPSRSWASTRRSSGFAAR